MNQSFQCVKIVLSNSQEGVDFAVRLVDTVLQLDEQVKFLGKFLMKFKLQWNLDIRKGPRTGKICSL